MYASLSDKSLYLFIKIQVVARLILIGKMQHHYLLLQDSKLHVIVSYDDVISGLLCSGFNSVPRQMIYSC